MDDSLRVSARDVWGSSAAAIPAATSLSPSRRLTYLSELLAEATRISFSFMQVPRVVEAHDVSSTGAPHGDFLDQPSIAVGVGKGEERSHSEPRTAICHRGILRNLYPRPLRHWAG